MHSLYFISTLYLLCACADMEGDRDGMRKMEMAKEIEKDRGVIWRKINKCSVPECRDPVFCFKTLIFNEKEPKMLVFIFQSVLRDTYIG
jgi:hypothetical protein